MQFTNGGTIGWLPLFPLEPLVPVAPIDKSLSQGSQVVRRWLSSFKSDKQL